MELRAARKRRLFLFMAIEKSEIRARVWDRLQEERLAHFPFPPHGRIPNFADARQAAERLHDSPVFDGVKRIKANPDSPQLPVRYLALARGVQVYMPTPRLKGGFKLLDPDKIPEGSLRKAASLSGCDKWAIEIPVRDLPQMDLIVCGSVAVDRQGHRCGKGEGYSDLEYAILRELGHPPTPVVTTVHDVQIVDRIPMDANDLPLSAVFTPTQILEVADPPDPPDKIDWSSLSDDDLNEMPILRDMLPD